MPAGGYQRPTSPAPVSGPGALSQRTDGGPGATQGAKYISGLPYGEGQEFEQMQQMAPMEAAPKIPASRANAIMEAPTQPFARNGVQQGDINLVSLNAPSMRPNEPVTAGVDIGLGPGSEVLPANIGVQGQYQNAQQLFDMLANQPDASPAMRYLAQRLGQAF